MPWYMSDAVRHTHKANTNRKKGTWAKIANDRLSHGDSEGSAIRQANAVVGRIRGSDGTSSAGGAGANHKVTGTDE